MTPLGLGSEKCVRACVSALRAYCGLKIDRKDKDLSANEHTCLLSAWKVYEDIEADWKKADGVSKRREMVLWEAQTEDGRKR